MDVASFSADDSSHFKLRISVGQPKTGTTKNLLLRTSIFKPLLAKRTPQIAALHYIPGGDRSITFAYDTSSKQPNYTLHF